MKPGAQHYQQVLDLDPHQALDGTGLATLCASQAQAGFIRPQQSLPALKWNKTVKFRAGFQLS